MRTRFLLSIPELSVHTHRDYPWSRSNPTARSASERLPQCLLSVRDQPALYRFLIYRNTRLEQIYVGETKHFASRMGQYCGMTRRLLLLALGTTAVVIEKHPFRLVQYHLAASLLSKHHRIFLEWTYLHSKLVKRSREAFERDEQRRLSRRHTRSRLIDGKKDGNFENGPAPLMPPWEAVHQSLQPWRNRKKLKPPFVVQR